MPNAHPWTQTHKQHYTDSKLYLAIYAYTNTLFVFVYVHTSNYLYMYIQYTIAISKKRGNDFE